MKPASAKASARLAEVRLAHIRTVLLVTIAVIGITSVAEAQTRPAQPAPARRGPGLQVEFVTSVGIVTPVSLGSSDITLTAPNGSDLVIGHTSTTLRAGLVLEAQAGIRLTSKLRVEGSGSWTSATYSTHVTGDIEQAESIDATASASQFAFDGAGVWSLRRKGKTEYFLRGSAGWTREIAEDTLLWDGITGSAGGGVKYWWRERTRGTVKRMGLRIDVRAVFRNIGLAESARKTRVSALFAGGITFGF